MDTRTETDSFGPIDVPAGSYWGAQTERSIANFPFGPREQMPLEIVHALGFVKQAAARVNAREGGLDPQLAGIGRLFRLSQRGACRAQQANGAASGSEEISDFGHDGLAEGFARP